MRGSHRPISTAVIDTSCLLFLDHLDLVPSLSIRYNKVYVPRYVFQEACRKQRKRYRLRRLIAQHGFLEICSVSSDTEVRLLSDTALKPATVIHRGEAETIIQARERRASTVLMDDRRGSLVAVRHTLAVRGTLGILKEFRQIRIIEGVAPLVEKLRKDLDYRINDDVLNEVLSDLEEL
jgi:uncharacterized protein